MEFKQYLESVQNERFVYNESYSVEDFEFDLGSETYLLDFNGSKDGQYRKATRFEPEEYPEENVELDKKNVRRLLNPSSKEYAKIKKIFDDEIDQNDKKDSRVAIEENGKYYIVLQKYDRKSIQWIYEPIEDQAIIKKIEDAFFKDAKSFKSVSEMMFD